MSTGPHFLYQKKRRTTCEAQNCANILWAFARRGRESGSRDLALAIAERAALLSHGWDERLGQSFGALWR